jgi:hypothetical protein
VEESKVTNKPPYLLLLLLLIALVSAVSFNYSTIAHGSSAYKSKVTPPPRSNIVTVIEPGLTKAEMARGCKAHNRKKTK